MLPRLLIGEGEKGDCVNSCTYCVWCCSLLCCIFLLSTKEQFIAAWIQNLLTKQEVASTGRHNMDMFLASDQVQASHATFAVIAAGCRHD